jgi:hypothetical protein
VGNDYQLITSVAIRTVDNLLCEEDADVADQAKAFMAKYPSLAKQPIGPVPTEQDMGGGEDRLLRGVRVLDKYYLFTWDTYQRGEHGHNYLGYRFVSPTGLIIFQGTDFGVPNGVAIDSDETLLALLKWFTPDAAQEDSDDLLGAGWTQPQVDFILSDDGDALNMAVNGHVEGYSFPFTDLPEYRHGEE